MNRDYLKAILNYDELTGLFTWISNNKVAGYKSKSGYIQIGIAGRLYYAHRLAMVYVHGYCAEQVDHINGVRDFNPIANLRNASQIENSRNLSKPKSNKSGVMGVSMDKVNRKWRATIKVNYKQINIGRFNSFNDAVQARVEAEKKYGFHENHGKSL